MLCVVCYMLVVACRVVFVVCLLLVSRFDCWLLFVCVLFVVGFLLCVVC